MLSPSLKNLESQLKAPAKSAAHAASKNANVKHAQDVKPSSVGAPKSHKRDEFSAWLDNEMDKQESGADLGVAKVEDRDLDPSALNARLMGEGEASHELQASAAGLSDKSLQVESSSLEAFPMDSEPMPKVMDPSLIEQVNQVVLPEQSKAEGAPLTMKDLLQQKGGGRSPAIDLSPSEVDPKLMNMEDFVAQKNAFARRLTAPNAYGMPAKTTAVEQSSEAKKLKDGLDALLTNDAAPLTAGLAASTLAIQGLGKNEGSDLNLNHNQKVFDLNQLQGQKLDVESLMTQITDYVVQARAAKEPTINLKMNHQDLGLIDITVNRAAGNMVQVALGAQDSSVRAFLGQHREQLLTHLGNAGVSVADLKVDLQASARSDAQNNQNASSGQGQQQHAGHHSEQNQRRNDQQRRSDLWQAAREQAVA